jgi:hypothetical protein
MLDSSDPELINALCASTDPGRPALTPGVELLGEMLGSGVQDRQWLATHDGQFIQMGELPYRICEHCTGTRSVDQIAAAVTSSTDLYVEPEQVAQIVHDTLMPTGLVCPAPMKARPRVLEALRARFRRLAS